MSLTKQVNIEHSLDDIAELLFNLDNEQVAKVISLWKLKFDQEYQRRKEAKETIWIFDLNHFMMHVVDRLDNDGVDFFRTAYSSIVLKFIDDSNNKHLTELYLKS